MKLKIKVSDHTTAAELRLLGTFLTGLANEYAVATFVAPTDEAELPPTTDTAGAVEGASVIITPKRKRRTKAEIEAEASAAAAELAEEGSKVAAAEAKAQASNEAELAKLNTEVAPEPNPTSSPAPTQTASEPEPAVSTPAAESPSDTKTYTPAEVQKIAVATAGRFGPEKVKAIIAQYPGAARIADLPLSELAGFVAKLNAVS